MAYDILGFDWDAINVEKIEMHDLGVDDVEFLFDQGDPDIFDHPQKAGRYIALGFIPDGRFILVVFEHDKQSRWSRVVTAYEPTSERWWQIYAKSKKIKT